MGGARKVMARGGAENREGRGHGWGQGHGDSNRDGGPDEKGSMTSTNIYIAKYQFKRDRV